MTAAVEADGVRKSYGGLEALRGVDLRVERGEVVAILGPNGAGKTTLMEILEGFRERDAGRVSVLGVDPRGAPRALRERVGIVLQECAMPPYLSVREVVELVAAYYPRPRPVDEMLELVGLHDRHGTRVLRLSGGQRRRLDLALALVGDPELVVLDEPTTGFDPQARQQAWAIVRDIRSLRTTVLLTTHYMEEAQALADRIVVVAAGRVVAEGDAATVGGRDRALTRIRFGLPATVSPKDLRIGDVVADSGMYLIETAEPTRVLAELCAAAAARGIELPGLEVSRPSLEDVYLRLVAEHGLDAGEDTPGEGAERARRSRRRRR